MVEQETTANPSPAERPFQFSLRQLLTAFVVIGAILAAFSWSVLPAAACLIFVVALMGLVVGCACQSRTTIVGSICIGLVSFISMLGDSREPPRRSVCASRLREIGKALQQYHRKHGCFPPAYAVDEAGTPIHSWRIKMLPYLDHQGLYEAYDFSEPWNGPHNSTLGDPHCYRCVGDRASGIGTANYLAVTGPGTAWPGAISAKLSDFDDPSKVILVVEVVGANVHWKEPRDLDVSNLNPAINSKTTIGISSYHKGGANVLFADGHVEFLPANKLPAEVQALLTPAPR